MIPEKQGEEVDYTPLIGDVPQRPHTRPRFKQFFQRNVLSHTPDISYEENEKNRWDNIRFFIMQKSLMNIILNLTIGSVFDTYIYLIFGNKNTWIGYIAGASGTTTLLAAVPIGILVDKLNRGFISKTACFLLLFSTVVGILSVAYDIVVGYFIFVVTMKVAMELSYSTGNTLFSDSLSLKERAGYIMFNDTIAAVSQSIGPFISVIYFLSSGNTWNLKFLRILICVSIAITAPTMAYTCYRMQSVNPHMITQAKEQVDELLLAAEQKANDIDPSEKREAVEIAKEKTFEDLRFSQMKKYTRVNPYVNISCTVIRMFGAGMLIKYLPLFFIEEFGFPPVTISILLFTQALSTAVCIQIAKQIAAPLGRPFASLFSFSIGTFALLGLAYSHNSIWAAILFIIRNGFQSCVVPIDQSLISDYTLSKNRGKWNAISSFTQFLWSGSAFFGGLLSDQYGFRVNFIFTSVIYILSNFIYASLLFISADEDTPFFIRWFKKKSTKTSQEMR